MWLIIALLILFVSIDVHYFIWFLITQLQCRIVRILRGKDLDLFTTARTRGICVTNDLDFMGHMNNARYLRNADFSRISFWVDTGVWKLIWNLGGSVTLGASTIRYRKSLQFLDRYEIHTRILCWDEKAFYVEHKYVRTRDDFVCAIAILKQVFIKVTPAEIVAKITGTNLSSPEFPAEVKAWIESNNFSSQKLRKDI